MTQKYQVKVSMKQAAIVETGIVLKQGDFGMQIEIEVLDFDATGTTPQIVFRKAMGAVESTTITVSSNKYTYTFKGTELDTPGKVFCDLKLKNSTTQRISTASFMFKVIADTMDGLNEQSSSYSDTIAQIVGGFDGDISDLRTSIHDFSEELDLGTWVQGTINNQGEEELFIKCGRTGYIETENSLYNISLASGYVCIIFKYNSSKTFIEKTDVLSDGASVTIDSAYIRVVFRSEDFSETINPSTVPGKISIRYNIKKYNDILIKDSEQDTALQGLSTAISNEETARINDISRTNYNLNDFSFPLDTGTWVQGSINNQGEEEIFIKSGRTDYIEIENTLFTVSLATGYVCVVCKYDSSKTFIEKSDVLSDGDTISLDCKYIRLLFRSEDFSETISPSTVPGKIAIRYNIKKYNDLLEKNDEQDTALTTAISTEQTARENDIASANYDMEDFSHIVSLGKWSQGSINNQGQEEVFNKCGRTDNYIATKNTEYLINLTSGYAAVLCLYDENKTFLGKSDALSNGDTITLSCAFIRIIFRSSDFSETINPSTIPSKISVRYSFKKYNDLVNSTAQLSSIASNAIMTQMLSGTSISSDTHKIFIVDDVKVDPDGNVYTTEYVADDSSHEGSNGSYLGMTFFNILDPSKYEFREVFKLGMHIPIPDSQQYDVVSEAHDGALAFIDSDTIRIIGWVKHYSSTIYMCYRDYTISTDTFGDIGYCQFSISGTDYSLDSETGKQTIIPALNLQNVNTSASDFYITQIVKVGSTFYAFITLGYQSNVLCKSTDCITWEFASEATTPQAYGEFAFKAWGNKIVAINRSGGNSGEVYNLYVCVYDTVEDSWEYLNIPKSTHGGNKPALAIQNDKAYFMQWVDGNSVVNGKTLPRTFKTIYKVDLNNMVLENKLPLPFDIPLCDAFFAEIGTGLYSLVSTDKRGFIVNGQSDGRSENSIAYFNPKYMDIK